MSRIRILEISGTPYEMGYRHGETYADAIRMFTEERVRLSSSEHWTGRNLSQAQVLALAEACLDEHRAYAPELVEELQGIADATGLGLAELVIMNGFTDFIDVVYNVGERVAQPGRVADNCTAFLVPDSATADGHGFFGQTWDMHATATPYVLLLHGKPADSPAFLSYTITGCVGMIGMNEAGIAVGINNLSGGDGQIGVTWPFVIRKILAQETLDEALECLTTAKLAGAHNYLLFDKHGRGYNIEAMSTHQHIDELEGEVIVHTNHCLIQRNINVERERTPESQANSEDRHAHANELLGQRPVTEDTLMALTRNEDSICRRPEPPMHVESCGAAIMRPATGDFWAVWGLPSENEYERITL